MGAMLPGLPGELLEQIVDSIDGDVLGFVGEGHYARKRAHGSLRMTCRELTRKLSRSYGMKYVRRLELSLNRKGLAKLSGLAQGELGFHIETITIHAESLGITQETLSHIHEKGSKPYKNYYRDLVHGGPLSQGRCYELLQEAFTRMPNLKVLSVIQPPKNVFARLPSLIPHSPKHLPDERTLRAIWNEWPESLWSVAVRTILETVLASDIHLTELTLGSPVDVAIPMDSSLINLAAQFMNPLKALDKLDISVAPGDDPCR